MNKKQLNTIQSYKSAFYATTVTFSNLVLFVTRILYDLSL